jgi:hypothetical protein
MPGIGEERYRITPEANACFSEYEAEVEPDAPLQDAGRAVRWLGMMVMVMVKAGHEL